MGIAKHATMKPWAIWGIDGTNARRIYSSTGGESSTSREIIDEYRQLLLGVSSGDFFCCLIVYEETPMTKSKKLIRHRTQREVIFFRLIDSDKWAEFVSDFDVSSLKWNI